MKSAWLPSEKWFLVLSSAVTFGFGALGVGLSRDTRPQVQIMPHARLPIPNGLDLYATAAWYSRSKLPVDPLLDWKFSSLSPSQKRARYSLARRDAWEKGAAPAWAFFEQAKAAQSLAPRGTAFIFRPANQLAFDKAARANTFALHGDWNGALRNDLDVVEMTHDLMRGAGLWAFQYGDSVNILGPSNAQFAGTRIGAKGEIQYDDIVPHLSAGEAKAGAKRLEELIESTPKLSDMAREQKAVDEEQWLQTWNQPAPGGSKFDVLFHPKTQQFEDYGRAMDKFIAVADKPRGAQGAIEMAPMTQMVSPMGQTDPQTSAFGYAWMRAAEQQLMLRLALRAYRLEHGTAPAKFSDLVPNYLAQLPIDPFGKGEKWRFQNGAAWSIGSDGKDDDGNPLPLQPPIAGAAYRGYGVSQGGRGDIVARG